MKQGIANIHQVDNTCMHQGELLLKQCIMLAGIGQS